MKGVLLVDLPSNCKKCEWGRNRTFCKRRGKDYPCMEIIPWWCPIKPLPEKKDVVVAGTVDLISLGWNDCIDDILEKPE